jgi:electron transport complex protein RnfC
MVIRALPGSAGYMFASWPASPPVFEGVGRGVRLRVPTPAAAARQPELIARDVPVHAGAPLVAPIEGLAATLAPVSGHARGATTATLTNGRAVTAVEFEPSEDPDPVWTAFDDPKALDPIHRAEAAQLIDWLDRLRAAGVGAERHTSPDLLAQLRLSAQRPVDTVICNLLDVDPSACLSAALAACYGIELAAGVMLVARLSRAGRAVVAIDARVPASWTSSMRRAGKGSLRFESMVNDYPQADPTLMLYTLLNRRLKPGRLPAELGVIQLDAAAAIAVGRCALQGAPLLSAPLAVRDHALRQSFFVFAPVGMRVADVLEQTRVGAACTVTRGGDVLRDVKLADDAVVSAAGELVLHASPPEPAVIPDPCIRCGWCGEACPTRLRPAGVLEAAQDEDVALGERYGLDACIECGICSYVCPSHLRLLDGVRRLRTLRGATQVTSSSVHVP